MTLRLAEDRLQAVHPEGERQEGRQGQVPHRQEDQDEEELRGGRGGAKVLASTAGSRNPEFLIDGTETTNWGGVTAGNVDTTHPSVTVDLAGKRKVKINRIQVSAMLNPARPSPRSCRSRPTPTPGRGSPRCARSPSRCASRPAPRPRQVAAGLRLQGRRVPGHRAAPGRAEPDPALVQAEEGGQGARRPPGHAGEPVHRRAGVRRRAGQRPDRRHRLQGGAPTGARSCTPPSCRCSGRWSRSASRRAQRERRAVPRTGATVAAVPASGRLRFARPPTRGPATRVSVRGAGYRPHGEAARTSRMPR